MFNSSELCSKLINSVQQFSTFFISIQHCSTVFNIVQQFSTFSISVQHCSTVFNSVQQFSTLFYSVQQCSTVFNSYSAVLPPSPMVFCSQHESSQASPCAGFWWLDCGALHRWMSSPPSELTRFHHPQPNHSHHRGVLATIVVQWNIPLVAVSVFLPMQSLHISASPTIEQIFCPTHLCSSILETKRKLYLQQPALS